jgi:hypothetical protein
MARYIALVQAIAARYDNEPYFEGMMFQEDVYTALSGGSDYTPANMTTQAKLLLNATVAAFPHTNVIFENTWGLGDGSTGTQNFQAWMADNRVAAGSADAIGDSAFLLPQTRGRPDALNWGMAAYMGLTDLGSTYSGGDLRSKTPLLIDVEGDDIAGPYYKKSGGPFAPADVCKAINNRYKATHAFWTRFMGSESIHGQPVPEFSKWPNLALALQSCPIQNTAYPASYPAG